MSNVVYVVEGPATVVEVSPTVGSASQLTSGTIPDARLPAGSRPATLTATYAPLGIRGARLVALGDSITQGSDLEEGFNGATASYYRESWVDFACGLSGQQIRRVRNVGIGGNSTAQMLARFDTDVTPYAPTLVTIMGGTNDITTSVTVSGSTPAATVLANYKANIAAIVDKCRAIGATPVLLTIPPNTTTSRHLLIAQMNLWLATWCAARGIALVDAHAVLTDPATGIYSAAAASPDGLHPGPQGNLLLGQAVAAKLNQLATSPSPCADNAADPTNLVTGGLMLGTPDGSGIPAGWYTWSGAVAGLTLSTVTDANIPGKMLRFTAAASASESIVAANVAAAAVTAGDIIEVSAVITKTAGVEVQIQYQYASTTHTPAFISSVNAVTRMTVTQRTVASGAAGMTLFLRCQAGTGTFDVGQVTVRNLTQLGLV